MSERREGQSAGRRSRHHAAATNADGRRIARFVDALGWAFVAALRAETLAREVPEHGAMPAGRRRR